jgi:hypothetical protein
MRTATISSVESYTKSLVASSCRSTPVLQGPFSYHQIDPIEESLIDAGFMDINIAILRLQKEIPDAALFARGLIYGNPIIDQIRTRGSVDPDRIVDAVAGRRSDVP